MPVEKDSPIRLFIADSHTLLRKGLRLLIEKSDSGVEVIGEAADGYDTLRQVATSRPDILVLDLMLSKIDGLEVLRRIRSVENIRTIILTAEIRKQEFDQALDLSVSGIVLKRAPSEELIKCIRLVSRGETWINRDIEGDTSPYETSSAVRPIPGQLRITAREMEVMNAIAAGCTNKEIATQLSISEQTVKHHVTNIFNKTGTSSRVELIHFAIANRLLDVSKLGLAGIAVET